MPEQRKIEEALTIIWELQESAAATVSKVREKITTELCDGVYEAITTNPLVKINGDVVSLSPEGERIARDLIRRQRLAERLLHDVLEMDEGHVSSFACEVEHILAKDVEENICTLLGHPRQCPHGYAIPEGACCKKAKSTIDSIVVPLSTLRAGQSAKVLYMLSGRHGQLHKLMSLGIVPGSTIIVHQTSPSYILKSGEMQIAIEREIAEAIFVKKT